MGKLSKPSAVIVLFCWIIIIYSVLDILLIVFIPVLVRVSSPYNLKYISHNIRFLAVCFFQVFIASLLLRLNEPARKVFIILAIIMTAVGINTSLHYYKQHSHNWSERFEVLKQNKMEEYKKTGKEFPTPPPARFVVIVVGVLFNLARLVWVILYVSGIALFTRPKIRDQFPRTPARPKIWV